MSEETKTPGYAARLRDFLLTRLKGATGQIPGKVVGTGPTTAMKEARAKLPLFLQVFGVLPVFDPLTPARKLHARPVRRAGVSRKNQYRDIDGNWQPFPEALKISKKARKLGFRGSWRSPSLKPLHALKVEHAARVRAKLEDTDGTGA